MVRQYSRLITSFICIFFAAFLASYDYFPLLLRNNYELIVKNTRFQAPTGVVLTPNSSEATLKIKKGDTLISILNRSRIEAIQIQSAIQALKSVFDPRSLKPEHEVYVTSSPQDQGEELNLLALVVRPEIDYEFIISQNEDGSFSASREEKILTHETRWIQGIIQESLYIDAKALGIPEKIISELIYALSFDVDFQRNIQPRNSFGIMYEVIKEQGGSKEHLGALLYGVLHLNDRSAKIYRFEPKNGAPNFYNEKGMRIQKALLRVPINGARLSSGYGRRRHPILGYTKFHRGIDFAAPRGTPIMAAGNGVIERASRWGNYGNYVRIRHNGTYKTAYAHLNRFARGVRARKTVRQGQVIGYVGTTGRSTGPHLHYEVLRNGSHINPRRLRHLKNEKLQGDKFKTFMLAKATIDKQSEELKLAYNQDNTTVGLKAEG